MAAETMGILRLMFFVNLVDKSVSLGNTADRAGTNKTSSYVSPSGISFSLSKDINYFLGVAQKYQNK
jgi:hypothetical protein